MKILLINPPHQAIGSRLAGEHLPPLGLLSVAGPLIDAGHHVELLDADYSNMKYAEIVDHTVDAGPDLVLMGHSGSTSAQPIINELLEQIKDRDPSVISVVGGVFPTFHWHELLADNPAIDYIVCGEGEQTALGLVTSLAGGRSVEGVRGIAYRKNDQPAQTPAASVIMDLDRYRVAWELMENYSYTYWGGKKAVVIQFSRGCPHSCTYCGQSIFWRKWRHRDPQLLADEIEMLHRRYGVEVINFADENPSSDPKAWKEFLEAIVAKDLDLILVGSIRADSIVRDADMLPLYKKAGFDRFLLGVENYDPTVLKEIKKGGSVSKDMEAIRLLRKNGILSLATYVVGFAEETTWDFVNSFRQLLKYDPDQVQLIYATPHKWTPYFKSVEDRRIIQTDQRKWDYKHQVIAMRNLKPWRVTLYFKLIELLMQIRPKALMRGFFHKDKRLRRAMFWYNNIGKNVWFYELFQFFFKDKRVTKGVRLKEFWRPLAAAVAQDPRQDPPSRSRRTGPAWYDPARMFKNRNHRDKTSQTAQGHHTLTHRLDLGRRISDQAK
jgi:anaerobic magnesium-protoporphyrin IX monomethyl ester cyclase